MNNEVTRIDFIRELIKDCRYEDAMEMIEAAFIQEPENYELYYEAGRLDFELGNYLDAIANYEQLLEHHQSAIIYFNLAEAYSANDEIDKAIGAHLRAISVNEKFPFSYKKLAMLFMARNDVESAIEYFNDYMELDITEDEKQSVKKIIERLEK